MDEWVPWTLTILNHPRANSKTMQAALQFGSAFLCSPMLSTKFVDAGGIFVLCELLQRSFLSSLLKLALLECVYQAMSYTAGLEDFIGWSDSSQRQMNDMANRSAEYSTARAAAQHRRSSAQQRGASELNSLHELRDCEMAGGEVSDGLGMADASEAVSGEAEVAEASSEAALAEQQPQLSRESKFDAMTVEVPEAEDVAHTEYEGDEVDGGLDEMLQDQDDGYHGDEALEEATPTTGYEILLAMMTTQQMPQVTTVAKKVLQLVTLYECAARVQVCHKSLVAVD